MKMALMVLVMLVAVVVLSVVEAAMMILVVWVLAVLVAFPPRVLQSDVMLLVQSVRFRGDGSFGNAHSNFGKG